MNLAEHPTVRRFHESQGERPDATDPPKPLDATWLRQLCLDCGADDAGLVEISRPALDDHPLRVRKRDGRPPFRHRGPRPSPKLHGARGHLDDDVSA